MTPEDKYDLKEVITGFGTGIIILGTIYGLIFFLSNLTNNSIESNTETDNNSKQSYAVVVGKYKECDIVRWNQNSMAEYKYFLYCEKNK